MRYLKKFILIYSLILFTVSCTQEQNTEPPQGNPITYKELFSERQGEQEFKARCITCHTLRYIEMQPPFPRKTWEKIVDKMVKNFGAPIPDSSVKVIVDYLVTVKGKE